MPYHISPRQERKNRWISIKRLLQQPFQEVKIFSQTYQIPQLYDWIVREDERQTGLHIPNWLNLGYWASETTYENACAALALLLSEKADLTTEDTVLDVGFGYGEQDLLWWKTYQPKAIHGINITDFQIQIAQEKIKNAGLEDAIFLQKASATALPFPAESFDKVLALESAFHFDTRAAFFAEAFRVLRKGGVLVLADVLPGTGRAGNNWLHWHSRRLCIPFANQYPREVYLQELQQAGFKSIECDDISAFVFPAVIELYEAKGRGTPLNEITIHLQSSNKTLQDWYDHFGWFFGFDEYLIFRAQKPKA